MLSTLEEFLRDACPNHTDKSKWNKSELLHILEMYEKQLNANRVSDALVCDHCDSDNVTEIQRPEYECNDCKERF